jgi:integrase
MGLGGAKAISLKEARELAAEARALCAKKIDPILHRRGARLAEKVAIAKTMTFAQCATDYIIAHEPSWRNDKHRQQWVNTLKADVHPLLGELPVSAIDTDLVMQVLTPIWATKPETASRVRGRIEAVLDWATVRGLRQGENPARWRGHLQHLLPAKTKVHAVEHHTALPYAELPAFMVELHSRQGMSARALEFTILTAARTGSTLGARWPEFDLVTGVWTIPAGRMKGGIEHRVPLAPRVVSLLHELHARRESEYTFPGARTGRPLSSMTMLKALVLIRADITVHGFRSTFRDWAAEQTAFPHEVCEQALAHAVGTAVERAYKRTDLFEKRRALMHQWATFCSTPARNTEKVVPLHAAQ